ncbi:phosphoribosylanthranilate isomerase [Micromonospora pisi]|uniref:N-(5'-phosphoribosyl)anthranilate isomerase n=1 Tax=Micromonospora pisi TaxID=589240 RepID=A0A495JCC3_9ACTN|nr:phosphoribosylanthranilate isomerase [Micromonospora pisi]RKR86158.1 phosphoribosylanthranilate isomerase [Micromonospora pisi]
MFVKVCGLRTAPDVAASVDAGADAIGFVLTPSPRQVTPAEARELAEAVPTDVLTVGVFRGEPVDVVRAAVAASGVRAIQLHGDEPATHYTALRELGLPLIRGTSPGGAAGLRPGALGEDLLIVDSPQPGSGAAWDWDTLDRAALAGRWLLAGGLRPDNVGAAIDALRPWGVDVSSGVEVRRGVKDPALIRVFLEAVRTRVGQN